VTVHANGTSKRAPNLLRVLVQTFGHDYLRLGIILGGLEALLLRIGQPLLLWQLIRHFSSMENESNYLPIYLNSVAIVGISLSVVFFSHPNLFRITTHGI